MKILNAYAGIGGNRRKWPDGVEVVAVEQDEKLAGVYADFFPSDKVVVGDAHEYILKNYNDFDFIWSSPPCQTHTSLNRINKRCKPRYPDMSIYQQVVLLREFFGGKFVVENVKPFYDPLISAQRVGRHLFWANFRINISDVSRPKGFIDAPVSDLKDWLGIKLDQVLYVGGNNCPAQVYRNCVHPDIGLGVLNCAGSAISGVELVGSDGQGDIFGGLL